MVEHLCIRPPDQIRQDYPDNFHIQIVDNPDTHSHKSHEVNLVQRHNLLGAFGSSSEMRCISAA